MIRILFVCTGNVFRRMIAEKCLKDYLKRNNIKNIKVDSAGTNTQDQMIEPAVAERLQFYNIKVDNQRPKQITEKLVKSNDSTVSALPLYIAI